MITQGIFGAISALSLGAADFMGRFSSRAIDQHNALFGMLLAGIIPLSCWVILVSGLPHLGNLSLGWVVLNGVATTIMTLLLYQGLARGPISVVAPIVAAHPVLVILYYVFVHGEVLVSVQWTAVFVTVFGTFLAGYRPTASTIATGYKTLSSTVFIALGSSVAYAVLVVAGQTASLVHGEVHTLWMGRIVSIVFLLLLFRIRQRPVTVPVRWWPFLCLQGLFDATGYIALFAGSAGDEKSVVTVVAATFGAVTIILARLILKENIGARQWLGITLVFTGVMALSQ